MYTYNEYVKRFCLGVVSPSTMKAYAMYAEVASISTDMVSLPKQSVSLASINICTATTTSTSKMPCASKSTMDKSMYTDNNKTAYLISRLSDARYTKTSAFETLFGLVDMTDPKSPQEAIDRIAAGLYTIKTKDRYYGFTDGLRWRDPKTVEDRAGFDAAVKALKDEKTKATDIIMSDDYDKGLAALQAFEAWQPTVATTTAQ